MANNTTVRLTLINGPTLLIEFAGLRILTDPTFDPPERLVLGDEILEKLTPPALAPETLLPIDVVLLSHDQHPDNLDRAGREFLPQAKLVFSTVGAEERLGGNCHGLKTWQSATVTASDGSKVTITGTPARHGPHGIEPVAGEVTGFILTTPGAPSVYVSGDTVWYPGIAEIAARFDVGLAILFTGAAQPRGPFNVTMDSNDAIEAAFAFTHAAIVAIHNEGWSHFKQSQADLAKAFQVVNIHRLRILEPAVPLELSLDHDHKKTTGTSENRGR